MNVRWSVTLGLVGALGCAADAGNGGQSSGSESTSVAPPVSSEASSSSGSEVTQGSGSTTGSSSGGSSGSADCLEAVTSVEVQTIFETNCVAYCHSSGGVWPQLDLSDPAYDVIVDEAGGEQVPMSNNPALRLISPNDIAHSYLVHKLRGSHAEAIGDKLLAGLRMPATAAGAEEGPALAEEQIQVIECWIEAGAPR